MKSRRIWTVGMVNYKSAVYLPYQLEGFYRYNKNFRFIIVDNSPTPQTELASLQKRYPIEIIYNNKGGERTGGDGHGLGLNMILARATSPYLLVQDPDFFWVKKGILEYLQRFLDDGNVAVGSQRLIGKGKNLLTVGARRRVIGISPEDLFPTPWGCAYRRSFLRDVDFLQHQTNEVGCKIRAKLANMPWVSFPLRNEPAKFGDHSFTVRIASCVYNGQRLAAHLFRGCFDGPAGEPTPATVPESWVKNRKKYAAHYLRELRISPGL